MEEDHKRSNFYCTAKLFGELYFRAITQADLARYAESGFCVGPGGPVSIGNRGGDDAQNACNVGRHLGDHRDQLHVRGRRSCAHATHEESQTCLRGA